VEPRLTAERLAFVSRLFVAPRARGQGVGAALLQVAWAAARDRGLRATLDVVGSDRAAVALNARAGWQRVTSIPVRRAGAGGAQAVLHTYLAPD
jgi:GNAT superfamily N-acetyltransferase